jgi:hypothetical protein
MVKEGTDKKIIDHIEKVINDKIGTYSEDKPSDEIKKKSDEAMNK